jgi:(2Fe-2S) ferredoxin
MIPGSDITKDPKVTVLKDSEACWLFVEINKSANFDNFMSYEIADGWTQGNGKDIPANVYYREVPAATADNIVFEVLEDNRVSVKDTVTKDMLNSGSFVNPTLTFKAYAVQKENVDSAVNAWKLVGTQGRP